MVQQYFSDSEWLALTQAPIQAILAVTLADKADPVSFLKEMRAGIMILASEQQRQHTNDLVNSLMTALNEADAKQEISDDTLLEHKEVALIRQLQTMKNAAEGRQQAIAHFQHIASILANKVTASQATNFKTWVISIARRVAEVDKEGGLFGIGGERISDSEAAVIKKIEETLAFKA